MKAMDASTKSFSVLSFSFGIVLLKVFGSLFENEKITLIRIIFLIFLCATFIFFTGSLKIMAFPGRPIWIVFCFITFISNGIGMILVNIYQLMTIGMQVRELFLVSFATAAITALILPCLALRRQKKINHIFKLKFVALAISAGVTTALGNYLSIYLNSMLPA